MKEFWYYSKLIFAVSLGTTVTFIVVLVGLVYLRSGDLLKQAIAVIAFAAIFFVGLYWVIRLAIAHTKEDEKSK